MGRSRSRSSRRGRTVLCLLLAVVVLAGLLYGGWRMARNPDPVTEAAAHSTVLTVRYRTDTPSTAAVGRPWLEVINTSDQPVALTDVTLRYYFSADDAAYGANCVQTSLRCPAVTETVTALPRPAPTASHYLQVGFTSAAGTLAPGQSSEAIGLQLYRLDHQALDQGNDRSFNGRSTHYTPSTLVTAYLRGALRWGQEPDGAEPTGQPGEPAPQQPGGAADPVPAGVLFDSFRYTDAADPALAANGWEVRTGGGGPGIDGTWTAGAVSFPADPQADGGQVLQLQATSDGTAQGTRQAELTSTGGRFFTGTLAARVHFVDQPDSGRAGDHVVESFSTISPSPAAARYSELDYEYQPNGGWGAPGPKLDTTSWRSAVRGDRDTRALQGSLAGWHIVMLTAVGATVTYSIDGRPVFHSAAASFPREAMKLHFSTWLIDLPFTGARTWSMRVNWVYAQAGQAISAAQVRSAVQRLYATGVNHLTTTAGA